MQQLIPTDPQLGTLPARMDCETAALIRGFLRPIFDHAQSWADLAARLAARGYALGFLEGRLVVLSREDGRALCTGRDLGAPLAELARRLGRPQLRTGRDGRSGRLV